MDLDNIPKMFYDYLNALLIYLEADELERFKENDTFYFIEIIWKKLQIYHYIYLFLTCIP